MRPDRRSSSCPLPCSTAPPGISTFSATTASRTWVDRQPVRVELLDVDDDVDLAGAAAGDGHLADAVDRLDGSREICLSAISVSVRRLIASGRDHQRHHRIGVGIDLGDDRRQQFGRHALDRAGDLLAHVAGRLR